MNKKAGFLGLLLTLTLFASCFSGVQQEESADDTPVDSSLVIREDECGDLLQEEENIISEHVDEVFDDFLFTFVSSRNMQKQRISFPLTVKYADGSTQELEMQDWYDDFAFLLQDEFYTVLYNSEKQIEEQKVDTVERYASVERIMLQTSEVKSYDFERIEGKWTLRGIEFSSFENTDMADFLRFYASFSSDSTYRDEHIAHHLVVSIADPDDDAQRIDGTIEREQLTTFCSTIPCGTISNIRYGQPYDNASRMLLLMSGQGNGMQEIFTFEKKADGWRLVKYEN